MTCKSPSFRKRGSETVEYNFRETLKDCSTNYDDAKTYISETNDNISCYDNHYQSIITNSLDFVNPEEQTESYINPIRYNVGLS